SSRRRHTRFSRDWSSDVCSSDLVSYWSWLVRRKPPASAPSNWWIASIRSGWRHNWTSARLEAHCTTHVAILRNSAAWYSRTSMRSEERRVGQEGVDRWVFFTRTL